MASTGYIDGLPSSISPEWAEWYRENHPRYPDIANQVEIRLAAWYEANDPDYKPADKKRHALLLEIGQGKKPLSELAVLDAEKLASAKSKPEEAPEPEPELEYSPLTGSPLLAVGQPIPVSSVNPVVAPVEAPLPGVKEVEVSSKAASDTKSAESAGGSK